MNTIRLSTLNRFNLFALLFLLGLATGCKKEKIEINDEEDFKQFVIDEAYHENVPAMSVMIFKDNEIKYEQYFGQSDVDQGIDLESNHVFLLASVSKVITATALLQLYDGGAFQLDDPINNYLPFNVNVPNETTAITFKMLLTHTSGIADGSALDGQYFYGQDSPNDLKDFLEAYLVPGGQYYDADDNYYDFEPGTEHEYSNVGNALIAVLVEELSGTGFNAYCKQNIFVPMGMTNSFWRLDEINQPIVQPYNYSNGSYDAIGHYTFTDYPNGGLRSNAQDLFKLLSAFNQGGVYNNYQLLESATISAMLTPQIPNIDGEVGLHLFLMNADNNLWGHDGGEQGVATIMAFNPGTKVGAIILANQGDANLDQLLVEAYKYGLTL